MLHFQGSFSRRAAGNGSLIVLLALGALLLVAAYLLGSIFGTASDDAPPPPAAPAATPLAEPAPAPAPAPAQTPAPSAVEDGAAHSRQSPPIAGRVPVRLDPPEVHLGVMRPGETAMAETRIHNISDRPLRITQGRPSCACTEVELPEHVISPGGSVPLRAAVDTSGTLGPLTSGVYVHFEGYEQFVPFRIVADVALPVRAQPAHIAATQDVAGQIVLESLDQRPFRLIAFSGLQPQIVGDVDEPRNRHTLLWDVSRFDPETCRDADGDSMATHFVIETDHPECRVLDLQIRHACTRREMPSGDQKWVMRNRRVYLGEVPAHEPTEIRVDMLWMQRARPDENIVAVVSDTDQFTAELVEFRNDGMDTECLVRLTPRPGHRGLIHGDVIFRSERGNSDRVIVIGAVAN